MVLETCSSGAAASQGIVLRPVQDGDLPFLGSLFAATRAAEVAATGWPEAMQRSFLAQQFDLQHRYYQAHHAGAEFLLLLRNAVPIGRLYWRDAAAEATLIDISLVACERGRGLGTVLLRERIARADAAGRAVGLHVEPDNPALRLYRRLGFEVVGDNQVYLKMRREPSCGVAPQAARHPQAALKAHTAARGTVATR